MKCSSCAIQCRIKHLEHIMSTCSDPKQMRVYQALLQWYRENPDRVHYDPQEDKNVD